MVPPPPPVTYLFRLVSSHPAALQANSVCNIAYFLGRRLKYNLNRIHGTVEKPKIPKPKKPKNQNQKKQKNQNQKNQKNQKNQNQKNQKYQENQFSGTLRKSYEASPRVPENCFFWYFWFFWFWFFWFFWFLYFWFFGFGILAFWFAFTGTRQQLRILKCAYANCAFQK